MNTFEVLNEIKGRVKPYIKVMPQSTFSRTIRDIEIGRCKHKTMIKFFAQFGYEFNEVTWRKK